MADCQPFERSALIIGCGIGGPVAAMALQKAGIRASIFEAHQGDAEYVGSFLNTASNGLDALGEIDAQPYVLARGFPTPRMTMWSGSGKRLGDVANGTTLPNGVDSITIERGQLHAALRAAAIDRGIPICSGKKLVGAERLADGVLVSFADGTHAAGDLLIGADGLHSQTRRLIDPDAPSPKYTGQLSLGGRARVATLDATPGTFHMIFGRRAFFGFSVPTSGDVYWFANIAWPGEPSTTYLSSIPLETWRTMLRELFEDDEGPAVEIIEGTASELAAYPVYEMPIVPHWHRDSMVIIGDAAHATSPSSGQGAAMAIEDAVVLAQCLRDCGRTESALLLYERLRRARVERVVAYSARLARTKTPGAIGRWWRDLAMPFVLKHFANPTSHAWLYKHQIDWSTHVTCAR